MTRHISRRPSTREYLALTTAGKQDIRAHQRTFDGAYIRTAVGQLSFALVVLRIFSRDYAPIGTLYTVYGMMVLFIALYRRSKILPLFLKRKQTAENPVDYFETSGNTVLLLGVLSVANYIVLFVLLFQLPA